MSAAAPREQAGVAILARAMGAFWRHDLLEQLSYPMTYLNRLLNLVVVVFLLYYGGRLVDDAAVPGVDAGYFLYGVTGWVAMAFLGVTLGSFRMRIMRYQMTGLLEACVMTRTPLWMVLLVMPTWDLVVAGVSGTLLLAVSMALAGTAPTLLGLLTALGYLALGLLSFTAIGMTSAALTLAYKSRDPLARLVTLGSVLIGGTFIPHEVLPGWMAAVGSWLPIAPMLDGFRGSLLGGGAPDGAALRLAVLAVVLVPIALTSARFAIGRVLRDGSMAHY